MAEYQLTKELLKLSKSQKWDEAKLEWEVIDVERSEEAETCLCGHYPIMEVCTIYNKTTGKDARVGNCCVKKFNDKSDKIFRAIDRIRKDLEKSVNSETLDIAVKKGLINSKDYNFYISILRKRNLSEKQLKWKTDLNQKLIKLTNKKKR